MPTIDCVGWLLVVPAIDANVNNVDGARASWPDAGKRLVYIYRYQRAGDGGRGRRLRGIGYGSTCIVSSGSPL